MSKPKTKGGLAHHLRFHPAAESAETDLIKITREYEELKHRLKVNSDRVEMYNEASQVARDHADTVIKDNCTKIEAARREGHELQARFDNMSELLSRAINS